jgi:hypothetical protein
MPKIPSDMSAAAQARRAKASADNKAAEAKKASEVVREAPKPRIAKKR